MVKKNNEDEKDKLRFENELKKLKLSIEKGAVFSNPSGNNNLSPEIENEFLKHIEAFENAYENADLISVYDFIGRPEYVKDEDVPDHRISDALENMMNVLCENEIALDTLCEVDDRTLYKFITEELFLHKIDNIRIKGMITHFTYEEFHPNHDYDIREYCTDFIQSFLNKDQDYATHLTSEAENDKYLLSFRDSFKSLTLKHFDIISITFNEKNASVRFNINFTGVIEESHETLDISGEGNIELLHMYDFWYIDKVQFPRN